MSLVWDMFHFRYLEHLSRNVQETVGYVALRCSTWTEDRGVGVSTTCVVTKALGMHDREIILNRALENTSPERRSRRR